MQALSYIHGAIYAVAGLWPVVHMRSFARVTGSKEIILLAVLSGVCLASIDVIGVLSGRISAVNLSDAWVEVLLAAAWVLLAMPPA